MTILTGHAINYKPLGREKERILDLMSDNIAEHEKESAQLLGSHFLELGSCLRNQKTFQREDNFHRIMHARSSG